MENMVNLYVTRTCTNPEIAWDFIKFMLQPKYQIYLIDTIGWLPARDDVDYSSVYEKTPQYLEFLEIPEDFDLYYMPPIDCYTEILSRLAERLVNAYLDQALLDNPEGIARVIHEAAEETNNILKENGLYQEE